MNQYRPTPTNEKIERNSKISQHSFLEEEFEMAPKLPFHLMNKEDINWFYSMRGELNQSYEGEWIAIQAKQIIGHNKSGLELKKQIQADFGEKSENYMVFFLERTNVIYAL